MVCLEQRQVVYEKSGHVCLQKKERAYCVFLVYYPIVPGIVRTANNVNTSEKRTKSSKKSNPLYNLWLDRSHLRSLWLVLAMQSRPAFWHQLVTICNRSPPPGFPNPVPQEKHDRTNPVNALTTHIQKHQFFEPKLAEKRLCFLPSLLGQRERL